jgi:hypothetical protein
MRLFKYRLDRLTEPQILFPLTALLLLTGVWAVTFGIARARYAAAERTAAASSAELLNTYEAQVVRALRDIDQTMNLVRFWHEQGSGRRGLEALKDHGLLPPDLLFAVSVSDAAGIIVDSTRPLHNDSVAARDYFRDQLIRDTFFVGQPGRDAGASAGGWTIRPGLSTASSSWR